MENSDFEDIKLQEPTDPYPVYDPPVPEPVPEPLPPTEPVPEPLPNPNPEPFPNPPEPIPAFTTNLTY